ncbi:MAG: hypothetical protein PHC43_00360 [Candidatus Marinimicrobia bacterium]|jgi:hypothetical protein|nr:hypothetical protein [Candidatus Neomarinimicrobiota bacterium]
MNELQEELSQEELSQLKVSLLITRTVCKGVLYSALIQSSIYLPYSYQNYNPKGSFWIKKFFVKLETKLGYFPLDLGLMMEGIISNKYFLYLYLDFGIKSFFLADFIKYKKTLLGIDVIGYDQIEYPIYVIEGILK